MINKKVQRNIVMKILSFITCSLCFLLCPNFSNSNSSNENIASSLLPIPVNLQPNQIISKNRDYAIGWESVEANTYSNLYNNQSNSNYPGLFSAIDGAIIKNIDIVKYNNSSILTNSYASKSVNSNEHTGDLLGWNGTVSSITNGHATRTLTRHPYIKRDSRS